MENGPAAAQFAALADKVSELGRMCARLSRENGALREQVERLSAVRAAQGAPAAPGGPAKSRAAGPVTVAAAGDASGRGGSGGGLVSRGIGVNAEGGTTGWHQLA